MPDDDLRERIALAIETLAAACEPVTDRGEAYRDGLREAARVARETPAGVPGGPGVAAAEAGVEVVVEAAAEALYPAHVAAVRAWAADPVPKPAGLRVEVGAFDASPGDDGPDPVLEVTLFDARPGPPARHWGERFEMGPGRLPDAFPWAEELDEMMRELLRICRFVHRRGAEGPPDA